MVSHFSKTFSPQIRTQPFTGVIKEQPPKVVMLGIKIEGLYKNFNFT